MSVLFHTFLFWVLWRTPVSSVSGLFFQAWTPFLQVLMSVRRRSQLCHNGAWPTMVVKPHPISESFKVEGTQ